MIFFACVKVLKLRGVTLRDSVVAFEGYCAKLLPLRSVTVGERQI